MIMNYVKLSSIKNGDNTYMLLKEVANFPPKINAM